MATMGDGRRKRGRRWAAVTGALVAGAGAMTAASAAGPPAQTPGAGRSSAPPPACPAPPAAVVRHAPGKGRTVALTIDDGPSGETPAVLAALAKAKVHATFFLIGSHVAPNAAAAQQAADAGHLVEDHS